MVVMLVVVVVVVVRAGEVSMSAVEDGLLLLVVAITDPELSMVDDR